MAVTIPNFLGERNVDDEKRLPINAMSSSMNIDLDDEGTVTMRGGFSLAQLFTALSASFITADEQRFFVVDNGDLKLINDDFSTLILETGIGNSYIKWLEVADYIFMSSGHIITPKLEVVDWRIPIPEQPKVTVISGTLPEGQYQVTSIYQDVTGREGAASPIVVVDVEEGSALAVEPSHIECYASYVYVTDTNGAVFYLFGQSLAGAVMISDTSLLTYPLDSEQLEAVNLPDPVGSIAFYESSMWAVQFIEGVSYLWRSKPFWWQLFDIHEDYLAIPGKVTALQGTLQGLFIGTDDEMYVFTPEGGLVRLAEYGVVGGKPISVTDDGRYFVWTKQGVCTLFPFQNVTEEKVSLPSGCICSTSIIKKNGYQQFMVLSDGSGTPFNQLI